MLQVTNFQPLLWRNRFSDHPVVIAEFTTDGAIGGAAGKLSAAALVAIRARFSDVPAGKVDLPALLAAMCLSMQREKYDAPAIFGADQSQLWFAAIDPLYAGVTVGAGAAFLKHVAARPQLTAEQLARHLERLVDGCEFAALDQSTRAMAAEATRRDIPWVRLGLGVPDIQLGQGFKQQRVHETTTSLESRLAAEYAMNKLMTYALLSDIGVPVGGVLSAATPEAAAEAATSIGFPVVLKPFDGSKGVGVVVGLADAEAVRRAAEPLLKTTKQVIVQSVFPGEDHRILVVAGRVVAAARREQAGVVGDGARTIAQLIEAANQDPRRGSRFFKVMNLIVVDEEVQRVLATQGLDLQSVPAVGRKVRLRLTANISTGGTAVDVTDTIHPDNVWLAERAAGAMGLAVAGVDFITPDISRPWLEVGGGVCEVNAMVGLRPHWVSNPDRDVVGPIMDTIFPPGEDGRIPTALITGTCGKTTTTRMLDHILRAAGHVVGSATTDGVTVNGRLLTEGDHAGAGAAVPLIRDPQITAAALETARGGLLKRGIAVDRCNVAALLNVHREQVGLGGVETLEDMARLKRKVVETATDAFVFNADNAYSHAVSRDFPAERTILFSMETSSAAAVKAHLAAGGTVVGLDGKAGAAKVVIRRRGRRIEVMDVAAIPATFDGRVAHNVANALAATALAHGMKVPAEVIAKGLSGFTASVEHSNARFNFIDDLPVRTLFDYASHPPAISTVLKAAQSFMAEASGRRICLLTSPGDRPDEQLDDCARAVAHGFDHYVCYEIKDYRRGRAIGETADRIATALIAAGVPADQVTSAPDQPEAMALAAQLAKPGDFLLVLGSTFKTAVVQLRDAFAEAGRG